MARKLIVVGLAMVLMLCLVMPVSVAAKSAADDSDIMKVTYYAKGGIPGAPPGGDESDGSYTLLGKGVKWDITKFPDGVSYAINDDGAPEGAMGEIITAFETWDAETSVKLFNDTVDTTSLTGVHQDYHNTLSWDVLDPGIIAQCSFWYSRITRKMIEFDIVFNSTMKWGIDEDGEEDGFTLTDAFDVRNIATHEIGHTLVLLDLYKDSDSEMTMYGYGDIGETNKISLEPGDIAGLRALYGA